MNVTELKRPGRPDNTITPLTVAESRKKDADALRERRAVDSKIGAARTRFIEQVRQRSSASDDAE